MQANHASPASARPDRTWIFASVISIATITLFAGCGGGGGGGGDSSASTGASASPAAATPAPAPAASSNSSCSTTPSTAASSTTASTSPVALNITPPATQVDHLIVKLLPVAVAAAAGTSASTAATATVAASAMASASDSSRVDAVIQRVMSRWNAPSVRAAYAATATAPAAPSVLLERPISGGASLLSLGQEMSAANASALAQVFASDPDVAYAEPDRRMFVHTVPTDPDYSQQWNLFDPTAGIDLPNAWSITTGSSTIVTAVLDTGYLPHPDLVGNLLPGYDFITDVNTGNDGHGRSADATDPGDWVTQQEYDDPSSPFYQCATGPQDSTWHGTQVAGIVGATANNGIGIAGVSWYGKILPVRVLGKCGGTTSDIVDAMRWAAGIPVTGVPNNPTPAKIINLSLGGTGPCGDTFQQAIDDVIAQGASVVVAAGNDGLSTSQDVPANCTGVIAVGATDDTAHRAWYSDDGTDVTLSAPGSNILTTTNTGTTVPAADTYATNSGTSLAAPQVSGVISLMLTENPALTPAQIAQQLAGTARGPGTATAGPCSTAPPGAGIVDAGAAVAAVSK